MYIMKKFDIIVNNRGVARVADFGHFERVATLAGFGGGVDSADFVTLGNCDSLYRVRKSELNNNSIIKFIKLNDLEIV